MQPFRKALLALAAVLTCLAFTPAVARTQEPTGPQRVEVAPTARPALWRVSDADTTIYLFGTVHALPKGIVWYDGKLAQAFEGSAELVTEVLDVNPAQLQGLVSAKALLPKGGNLRTMLQPDERARLEAVLARYGLSKSHFDAYEPWFAAIGLATLPQLHEGYTAENGVESVLDARARQLGRPRRALETVEFQLSLFDTLPPEVQRRYLNEVVEQLPGFSAELEQIVAAWKVGDAEKLAELVNSEEDDPALMEALLINRNKSWAEWIRARLDRPGTVFVAVGAGHLAGKGSVQRQLARKGISTRRVQ